MMQCRAIERRPLQQIAALKSYSHYIITSSLLLGIVDRFLLFKFRPSERIFTSKCYTRGALCAVTCSSSGNSRSNSYGSPWFGVTIAASLLLSFCDPLSPRSNRRGNCECSASTWPTYSRKQVEAHNTTETGLWVTYKEGVYDVSEFLSSHPGGKERLLEAGGHDLSMFWSQPLYRLHFRSPLALELLEDMRIGTLPPEDVITPPSDFAKAKSKYPTNRIYECIVLGSGVSGLQCARSLSHDHGLSNSDVLVLEAQDYVGGRVKQVSEFIKGVDIDVGAEFLHGDNTALTKFAAETDQPLRKLFCWAHGDGGPLPYTVDSGYGLYYTRNKSGDSKLLRFDSKDEKFVKINETLWGLSTLDHETQSDEASLKDYLVEEGFSEEMLAMANAGFANTLCSTIDSLSLKRCVQWEGLWHGNEEDGEDEEHDFNFKKSFKCLVDHLKEGLQIETDKPVTNISYTPKFTDDNSPFCELVKVDTADGETYYAKSVVITASPYVLKSGILNFSPPLSENITEALDTVAMNSIVKVILKFSSPVWPKNLHGMVMADSSDKPFLLPEVWFRDLSDDAHTLPADEPARAYAIGFTTSQYAARLSDLPPHEVVKQCIYQLEEVFSHLRPEHMSGDPLDPTIQAPESLPKPSEAFLGGMLWDWTPAHHPYIGGGYCSPLAGKETHLADMLSEPYGNGNIFFAGEATHLPGATAHAALDSGERAARQVASLLKQELSMKNEVMSSSVRDEE